MKKILLSAGLFCLSFASNAQCTAISTFNENFENFTNNSPLTENCWSSNTGSPKVTISTVATSKVIQLYSFMSPTVPFYVVSPELNTIDGNHKLSFELKPIAGTMTVQVGTLSNATDFTTFQAVGSPIEVSSAVTTFSNIVIPASTTQKYIAFKAVAVNQHMAASLDNVSWQPTLGIEDSNLISFKVYPNPSVDRNITISSDSQLIGNDKNSISIYSLTGAKVFETEMKNNSGNTNTINLSDLTAGIYIMKIQSGDFNTTKKLVLK